MPARPVSSRVLVVDRARVVWGTERVLLGVAPALAERGIELVLGSSGGEFEAAWRSAGLPTTPLRLPDHAGIRSSDGGRPSAAALAGEAVKVVRGALAVARAARKVDLVYSNSLWTQLDAVAGAKLARRPVVVHLHDLVAPGVGRRLQDLAVRRADAAIAISAAVAGAVGSRVRPEVEVVHNGVDLGRFHPRVADPGMRAALGGEDVGPLVGVIGRVDPEKGIEVVARAVARLDGPLAGARLVVVGSPFRAGPSYVAQVEALLDELLGPRARIVGGAIDVSEVIPALDIVVNASHAEPFGMTLVEAQASGVPVIATDAGGAPEIVVDGVTGLLVPPGDDVALAGALTRVLGDPLLRGELVAKALAAVQGHGSVDRQADQIAAVFRRVLQ